jgi:hypothetical protein
MRVYCTTKNTGPSWRSDPLQILYLGTSVKAAEEAVGKFTKYAKEEKDFPVNYPHVYSAIPEEIERELIQFFMVDGWWYSIVMFELHEDEKSVSDPREVNFDECKVGKHYFVSGSGTIFELPD